MQTDNSPLASDNAAAVADFNSATGPVAIRMNNDYLFRFFKRMEAQGRFRWPRNSAEIRALTWQQFGWLMSGLEIEQPKAFRLPGNADDISS